MKTKSILGLLMCIALVFSLSFAQPANAASAEEEILQTMEHFDEAINTADLELMTSLYWQSPKYSGFGPQKSLAFLTQGWERGRELWRSMFEYPAGTYNSSSQIVQILMLGDDVAIMAGYSTITLNPPVVEEVISELLRFTSVVQKIDGKWLTVHGHTSILPTE